MVWTEDYRLTLSRRQGADASVFDVQLHRIQVEEKDGTVCRRAVDLVLGEDRAFILQPEWIKRTAAASRQLYRWIGDADSQRFDMLLLGGELWDALPAGVRKELEQFRASDHVYPDGSRDKAEGLCLQIVTDAPEAAKLPWEALDIGTTTGGPAPPVLTRRWRILRYQPHRGAGPEPIAADPLRVLVLVGSLRQSEQVTLDHDALDRVVEALEDCEVTVAGPTAMLQRLPAHVKPHSLQDQVSLRAALGSGHHVIQFLGHSAAGANGRPFATGLRFELDSGDATMEFEDFGQALRGTTRVVVLAACETHEVAGPTLLRNVPHVVAMNAVAPLSFVPVWSKPFHEALRRYRSVTYACEEARAAIVRHQQKAAGGRSEAPWSSFAWAPVHWASTATPHAFADDRTMAIHRYCTWVEQRHRQFLGAARRFGDALEAVHVRLRIRPYRPHGDRRGLTRVLPSKAEADTPGDPVEFPQLLVTEPRRWILGGGPGAGKTTTLRYEAQRLARDENRALVPVYLGLASFLPGQSAGPLVLENGEHIPAYLERRTRIPGLAAALQHGSTQLAVFFDGLDEIVPQQREVLLDLLPSLQARVIVIGSRRFQLHKPGDQYAEADLEPLQPSQKRSLLERLLRRGGMAHLQAARVVEEWARRFQGPMRAWRELSDLPLFVSLIARLLLDGKQPASHRSRLYDQFFASLCQGDHKGEGHKPLPNREQALDLLAWLAWRMTRESRSSLPFETWDGTPSVLGWLAEVPPAMQQELANPRKPWVDAPRNQGEPARDFLTAVADCTLIFGPEFENEEGCEWRFWHASFREALCARHWKKYELRSLPLPSKVEELAGLKGAALEQAIDFWSEPMAFLAGSTSGGDAAVLPLLEERGEATVPRRDLAFRLLDAMDRLSPATVAQGLRHLRGARDQDDWDRWPSWALLLERLPGRTGGSVEIVEVLRAHGLDRQVAGRELGALVNCLQDIGRHPDLAAAAAAARDSILDGRLPLLGEDSLRRFSCIPRRDGDPLWRLILAAGDKATYRMGSPQGEDGRADDEGPVAVELDAPFALMRVPVTEGLYHLMEPGHEQEEDVAQYCPASYVAWWDACLFAAWLDRQRRRLPDAWAAVVGPAGVPSDWCVMLQSEAQWEYAARASHATAWPLEPGQELEDIAWFHKNSGMHRMPVATRAASRFQLFDMLGNVWEWCLDGYERELTGGRNPVGSASARWRALRGGGYWGGATDCRTACRYHNQPVDRGDFIGFRLLLSKHPVDPIW